MLYEEQILRNFLEWLNEHTKGEYEATQPLTPSLLLQYHKMYIGDFFKKGHNDD